MMVMSVTDGDGDGVVSLIRSLMSVIDKCH